MREKLIFLIFVFCSSFCFTSSVSSEGGSLYLSPGSGTFSVGSTFDVSIFTNTGGQDINTVKVDLEFDPKKLQIASPTAGKSFISVWISQPTYSNVEGKISFQGGVPSPGINTSAGLVSTITFRAIAPGETNIYILDSSRILLDDGKGTDILTSLSRGYYTIKVPPPEGPSIFSSTHPDQNKWYKNSNPSLSWEKEEGVTGFSYTIDKDFHNSPDSETEGDETSVSYSDLEDGIWYFHLKSKKGDVWGGVSHYVIQIDKTAPADFKLKFEPYLENFVIDSSEPIVSFITTDVLSGLDHFEIKTINLNKIIEGEEASFFIEANSPYKLPSLEPGEYEVVVRVYDKAMNYRDVSERIEIVPARKGIYFSKRGINLWFIFLSWGKIILVFILLLIFIIILILFWYRHYRKLEKRNELLRKLGRKVKEDSDLLKKRIYDNQSD